MSEAVKLYWVLMWDCPDCKLTTPAPPGIKCGDMLDCECCGRMSVAGQIENQPGDTR